MTRAQRAADATADWIIRLYEDLTLLHSLWRLLRRADDRSPTMRVKLAAAQATLAAVRTDHKMRA